MGKSIVYDTVNGKQWRWSVDIRTHPINVVIENILSKNESVPEAFTENDCVECHQWEYGDYLNSSRRRPHLG